MATAPNAAGLAAGQATIVRLPVKPSRVKLTARNVLALPGPSQGSERMFYDSDVPALALRISSSGHRTFVVTGRTGSGRSFRMKLGDARSITPAAARRAAQAIMGKIALGQDPAAERRLARAERRAARQALEAPPAADAVEPVVTLGAVVIAFLTAAEARLRPSTWWSYQSTLRRLVLPVLGTKAIIEITRADLDQLHATITRTAGPVCANRCRAILSGVFAQAERNEVIARNPVRGSARTRERDRERVLPPVEIARLLAAARAREDDAGRMIEFLLLSACRKGEALAMVWRDLDLPGNTWTKPGASTKAGRDHRVPLSSEAVELLRSLGPGEPHERVFSTSGSALQRAFRSCCRAAGIVDARLHDLRRTCATLLCAAGTPMPTVGRLLAHAPGSAITSRIYARSTSAAEIEAVAQLGKIVQ
jgi:integrase